jgi:hypothetical protein
MINGASASTVHINQPIFLCKLCIVAVICQQSKMKLLLLVFALHAIVEISADGEVTKKNPRDSK